MFVHFHLRLIKGCLLGLVRINETPRGCVVAFVLCLGTTTAQEGCVGFACGSISTHKGCVCFSWPVKNTARVSGIVFALGSTRHQHRVCLFDLSLGLTTRNTMGGV